MLRPAVVCVMAAAVVAAASCGDSPSASEPTVPESTGSVVTSDLDSVAEAWGEAVFTNDWASMAALLKPSARQTVSEQLKTMESVTPPGDVTLSDMAFEVVAEEAGIAEVRYSGTRCAPTISTTFGPSTVVGDSGSDTTTLSSEGVTVEGEVVCADLATPEVGPWGSPFKFVQIDGQWYGTMPGL